MYDKSQFHGIDPVETRQASQQMERSADGLQGLVGQIGALLDGVVWEGADARRAVGDWNGQLRPELANVVTSLRDSCQELNRRAQMQEDASS